ncbi:uncharacterized protein L203_101150 [Cryptococcus depauperatus CBS 7841]|uniref:Uncharacterized protein n=1 Tax=Cryptococcus depauperatus CBS 7841 TaxID=1295531 RepID=A0A1E3IKL6_9TREE|nr:hypothetical protein L203_02381 [Cryptococcus depauperatus CBS 7841]
MNYSHPISKSLGRRPILQPRRHSSEQSVAAPKFQLRNRISHWSVNKNKRTNNGRQESHTEPRSEEAENDLMMYRNGHDVYDRQSKLNDQSFKDRSTQIPVRILSLPSISTSPSALSFPIPPPRDSVSSSRDLPEHDWQMSFSLDEYADNEPPPIPPSKSKRHIFQRDQSTAKASQSVAFDLSNVATHTRAISVSSAMREAPSVNSFTAQGSFVVLPEEIDLYLSQIKTDSPPQGLSAPRSLSARDIALKTRKSLPTLTSQRSPRKIRQVNHKKSDSALRNVKAGDGQFSDASDAENSSKDKCDHESLPPILAKSLLKCQLSSSTSSESKMPLSLSIPAQISDVFYTSKLADATEPLGNSSGSVAVEPADQWRSSTPRQSPHSNIKVKTYERSVSTRFIELFESEEQDGHDESKVVRKFVKKELVQESALDVSPPVTSSDKIIQHNNSSILSPTESAAQEISLTFDDALTRNMLRQANFKESAAQQHTLNRTSTDSTATAGKFIGNVLKVLNSRSSEHEGSRKHQSNHRIIREKDAQPEDVNDGLEIISPKPIVVRRPQRCPSFADSIRNQTVHSVRPRQHSLASSANSHEQSNFLTISSTKNSRFLNHSVNSRHVSGSNIDCGNPYEGTDFRLSLYYEKGPNTRRTTISKHLSNLKTKSASKLKTSQLLIDPFASFDPYPPITPVQSIPNDPYVLITNTAVDELLEGVGWGKVEKRWVEGETFWAWLIRRLRREGINEARQRKTRICESTYSHHKRRVAVASRWAQKEQ